MARQKQSETAHSYAHFPSSEFIKSFPRLLNKERSFHQSFFLLFSSMTDYVKKKVREAAFAGDAQNARRSSCTINREAEE